jgi:hypothetical protein
MAMATSRPWFRPQVPLQSPVQLRARPARTDRPLFAQFRVQGVRKDRAHAWCLDFDG